MQKWKILNEEDISPSKWFPLVKQSVQLPNEKILDDYYIARLGNVSMTIPITANKEIVFVCQYKNGIAEFTLELPAGFIEANQTPEEAAIAELEQETGIKTSNLKFVGELWTMPTKVDTRLYGFIAVDVTVNSKQKLDLSENIEIVYVATTNGELESLIKEGKINCSDTLALLALAKMKFPDLF
ncbi:MAG: NUDIX hydrolase [Oligoflexia bacterium]|nr:NUDIX hydrolase [Oligoflexia bacterium]